VARAREEVKTALQRVMGAYSGASDVEQGAERVAEAAARLDALWGAVAPLAADSSPAERALQRVLIDGEAPAAVALSGTHAPAGPDGRPGPPELEALLQRWAACLGQVQRQLTHHASGRAGLESLGRAADAAQHAAQQSQQGLAAARAARERLEAARDKAAAAARELRAALGPPPAEPFTAASLSAAHPLNLSTSPSSASAVCMPAPSAAFSARATHAGSHRRAAGHASALPPRLTGAPSRTPAGALNRRGRRVSPSKRPRPRGFSREIEQLARPLPE
jgi:hypothetical protein